MEPTSTKPLFELHLDYESANQWKDTVKWSRFISIIYFVAIGLMVLGLAFGSTAMVDALHKTMPGIEAMSGAIIAVLIVALMIFTWTSILLYRFSNLTREGIVRQDQEVFNSGLKSLKIYFTVYGIFSILGLLANIFTLITAFRN